MAKKTITPVKETRVEEAVAVPLPPVVDVPVVDVPVDVDADVPVDADDMTTKFEKLLANMNSMMVSLKDSQTSLKTMQKEYGKMLKTMNKKTRKVNNGTKRAPSGFAKPTFLSDEICKFLNIDKGTMLARTEVTRLINQYIKANNLQYEKDRRRIIPDAALQKIIQSKEDDIVTYFNLQSFIKHHFKEKEV
jgi:chromatin remodeling complex protein RSC6